MLRPAKRPRPGPPSHHEDFLKHLAIKKAQRKAKKQAPLSAEAHAANRQRLSKVRFVKPKYSQETQINVSGIFRKWTRYCEEKNVGNWKTTVENLTRAVTMDFLLFICTNYRVGSWGTSNEYIRQFQQLYTTVTGQFMDRNDVKEVYKYHHNILVPEFGLRAPNIDGKPVLNVDSLRTILTFNIAYDAGIFHLELHRINLAACYQLLCYTGVRPAELVNGERQKPKDGSIEKLFGQKVVMSSSGDEGAETPADAASAELTKMLSQETTGRGRPKALCYEDILMLIVRHPVTGRPLPAMAIKFIHHKGADNKPKPTIFFFTPTRQLLFCPVMTILSLALHDQAFDAPNLKTASDVLNAEVWGPTECMPLRWKEDKLKLPVFRRVQGGEVSATEAMLYSKLNYDMGRQSLDSGHEKAWTPRFARRGAGNAANGDASDAVRDQMMRHDPSFQTFYSAYLNEVARFDLQNAFLEKEKQDQLFRMFAHVSLTRDPRATRDMVPPEVWKNAAPDPDILSLEEQRNRLKQGRHRIAGHKHEEEIRKLTEKIRTKRAEYERIIVKEYREYYFYNRPTWDFEAQARGEIEEAYKEPAIEVAIPERARLANLLCHQPQNLTNEQLTQRRVEVVDLMVALCDKRDTGRVNEARPHLQSEQPMKEESPDIDPDPKVAEPQAGDAFPLLMNANQCPDCIGDDRLTLRERTFRWCRPTVRNDHFDDRHLVARERAMGGGSKMICNHPRCRGKIFEHLDHFRNHVESVHGVSLRTSDQVAERRLRKLHRRQMVRAER